MMWGFGFVVVVVNQTSVRSDLITLICRRFELLNWDRRGYNVNLQSLFFFLFFFCSVGAYPPVTGKGYEAIVLRIYIYTYFRF